MLPKGATELGYAGYVCSSRVPRVPQLDSRTDNPKGRKCGYQRMPSCPACTRCRRSLRHGLSTIAMARVDDTQCWMTPEDDNDDEYDEDDEPV